MYRYFLLLLLVGCATARTSEKEAEARLAAALRQHVTYLADDKLEGRRAGTAGEKLAAEYISQQFRQAGLEPKGVVGFFQPFDIPDGKEITAATTLVIEGKKLVAPADFFPLSSSANGQVHALPSIALNESDMPWFYDLKEMLRDNRNNPHFDLENAITEKVQDAYKKGATAFIVYNTSSTDDELHFDRMDKSETLPIPAVYVKKEAAQQYFADPSAMVDINLNVELAQRKRTGRNVIGYINNNASKTVVIGAHFDHLGYGEDKNSRYTGRDSMVHNGADDNASGTAALIELASRLKKSNLHNNNYLFIAFSGEELGLFGSKYFTENPTIPLEQVNYMINMDMLGRLNDSTKILTVHGYGTSPAWGALYNGKINSYQLQFRFDSSGTGPSDHTSFYRKDIPVLFYFTGLHTDYHTPADDADKINYRGEARVVEHIFSVIKTLDEQGQKLAFSKTREVQTTTSARFSVSLGIMPDYTFGGPGVRVDGVSEGKAAAKAGLQAGDVITALGEHKTSSMEGYMQALASFKKGDKTTVYFLRGQQSLSASVEF
ncbi:MAG: M20/M25/M40 family metallo-hydrolase [Flavisolibacter sp.]